MTSLPSLMDALLGRLGWTSLQAALLVGAIWLICRQLPRLSAATRSLMSIPTPTRCGRPSSSTRRPVKKYGVTVPSFETNPASTFPSPVSSTRPMRSVSKGTSPPRKKCSGCASIISAAVYPETSRKRWFQRRKRPFSS